MRFRTVGKGPDKAYIVVRNSASVSIPSGSPVYFNMGSTTAGAINGVDIVDPGTAYNAANSGGLLNFPAGVLDLGIQSSLAPGQYGESQVYGFCQSVRLMVQQRTSSTKTFPSFAAVSVGDWLQPGILAGTQITDAFADYGGGATNNPAQYYLYNLNGFVWLAQSLASIASSASSQIASNVLYSATTVNAFIQML